MTILSQKQENYIIYGPKEKKIYLLVVLEGLEKQGNSIYIRKK